jgi:hypothetical protein
LAPRKQSKGACAYCGKEMAKGAMTKHLGTCGKRLEAIAQAEAGKAIPETLFHLRVQDAYRKEFWLDLEMRGSKSLQDLDTYLRALTHIYDFGTSSETMVKLVEVRQGKPTTSRAIALMARNLMPEEKCIECGKPATHLCMECLYEDQTWGTLCDAHIKTHPHHNYEEPILLVNSPRLGMCGYDGPAEPPY